MILRIAHLKPKKRSFYPGFILLGLLLAILFSRSSVAQTEPLLLISWQAKNFAPLGFEGKNLPIINTPVTVGVDLIEKNQLISLKNYEVRWFLDGKLKNSGEGLTTWNFLAGQRGDVDEHSIRLEIIGYKGRNLTKTITMPLTRPQIVVLPPYRNYQMPIIKPGLNTFKTLPYFFNVENLGGLTINWKAGGTQTGSDVANQDILNLNIPQTAPDNFVLPLEVLATNKNQPLEKANQTINLTLIR